MTHFLIVYDQAAGRVVEFEEFPESARETALDRRFALERKHAADQNLEVVMLTAVSREALELTHARYFKDIQGLAAT